MTRKEKISKFLAENFYYRQNIIYQDFYDNYICGNDKQQKNKYYHILDNEIKLINSNGNIINFMISDKIYKEFIILNEKEQKLLCDTLTLTDYKIAENDAYNTIFRIQREILDDMELNNYK